MINADTSDGKGVSVGDIGKEDSENWTTLQFN